MSNILKAFYDHHPRQEDLAIALEKGLSRQQKSLPPKYFYDVEGSRLFEQICELPEYYPTRTEIGILERNCQEIAALVGPECHLIEFGSGSSAKVRILLDALERPASYLPIDISYEHLLASAEKLARLFPTVPVSAICADYTKPVQLPELGPGQRIGFFPGSSIGNFDRDDAVTFLKRVRTTLADGGLIIGVDLIKTKTLLDAAYNDSQGVTAAFNKNLLVRLNRELGAEIDLDCFDHLSFYDIEKERIEMHLVSNCDQVLTIGGKEYRFRSGERIHTENSYKYSIESFHEMVREAGFSPHTVWTDDDQWFSVHYLSAE